MTLDRCGCCKGVEKLTQAVISNRPGLSTLSHRMGTHWSFLQTMKSSLSAGDHPELRGLSTREKDDFSMALMDAWAMVADILTFYQERIATEGYLRTATERWSILELARLVGYRLRPGVASSTYLAFTLEKGYELEIPKGTRAQSLPDPGELPQSFETMEKVWAREEWGRLLPRTTKPQVITPNPSAETIGHLYVQGLNHELKAGYPIVFDFKSTAIARSIASVELQPEKNRTKINFIPLKTNEEASKTQNKEAPKTQTLNDLVSKLIPKTNEPTDWQPRIEDAFGIGSDSHLQVFATQCLSGEDQKNLYAALKGDLLSSEPVLNSVRAFGLSAPVFGYNAPKEQIWDERGLPTGSSREWAIGGRRTIGVHVSPEQQPYAENAGTGLIPLQFELSVEVKGISERFQGSLESTDPFEIGDETISIDSLQEESDFVATFEFKKSDRKFKLIWSDSKLTLEVSDIGADPSKDGSFIFKTIPTNSGKWQKNIGGHLIKIEFDSIYNVYIEDELSMPMPSDDAKRSTVLIDAPGRNIASGTWVVIDRPHEIDNTKRKRIFAQVDASDPITESDYGIQATVTPLKLKGQCYQQILNFGGTYDMYAFRWNPSVNEKELKDFLETKLAIKWAKDATISSSNDTINVFDTTNSLELELSDEENKVFIKIDDKTIYELDAREENGELKIYEVSRLSAREWLSDKDTSLDVIRNTVVYAENSELNLAGEPIGGSIKGKEIELDGLYGSLEPGRMLIVSGERADLPGATDTELAVLSGTFQGKHKDNGNEIESDTLHTFLRLADSLGHEYKRDTVTIFANVARATHGETREEILGSGDGSKNFQEFHLRQSPLTYLAAPTPAGAESTLDIRVNGVLWHEKDSLLQEGPRDRSFITKTDNEDKTETIFGDGVHGARLPSGVENIKAVYRTGIGKAGNVRANQITILASKPLGLKEVINPLPATGGADRDTIDQARRNIPLTAMSLDHLVSVKDYEDFAKSFAAIGKASATHLSDGRRRLVHVTIAGKGNVPIDKSSDLYLNLVQALFKFGDPNLAIQVDMSEQRLLLMDAEISIGPDYLWSEVEPKIRTKLLERFGFERRELGQDIHLSEIISAMTEIDGVTYVDVNIFHDLPGTILPESLERLVKFILKPAPDGIYRPNQCIYAGPARIEEKYEAEGWEDPQFIANRYGTTLNDLTELNNPADITEKISQHQEIIVPRTIMPAQIAFFTPYVKEMLNLRPRVSRNE